MAKPHKSIQEQIALEREQFVGSKTFKKDYYKRCFAKKQKVNLQVD